MMDNPDHGTEPPSRSDPSEVVENAVLAGLNPAIWFTRALTGRGSSPTGKTPWTPPTVEEIQRELPQYPIVGLIGRGGMGAVYKARQVQLNRLVAIKILPPGIDHEGMQFTGRFQQEAKMMAGFNHPNIASVHDAGETTGGWLYFVMEFIDGRDVAELLAEHDKLPPAEAIRITVKVCEALAYAHERGVVHRDIKPSNVMIEQDGTVKVADFGLAKLTSHAGQEFTRSDMALGSPDFLAPECSVAGCQPDGRADVFSLGVMLYQMLTGRLPRGRFEPPTSVVPQVDPRLDAIIDKALQTDREKRYSGSPAMLADLRKLNAGNSTFFHALANFPACAKRHPYITALAITFAAVIGWIAVPKITKTARDRTGTVAAQPAPPSGVILARPKWQNVNFAKLDPAAATEMRSYLAMEGEFLHIWNSDRWLVPTRLGVETKLVQRNVALRATVRAKQDSMPKITLRFQRPGEVQYAAILHADRIALIRQSGVGQDNIHYLGNYPLPRIPAEGEETNFQFACIGQHLSVWFEGKLLGQVEENALSNTGEFGIQAKNSSFGSIDYLLLDDMSEDAATKLIANETQ